MKRKLIIIGIDCATPQFVFGVFLDSLPNIRSLIGRGVHARLNSTVPPITIPAWMCMMTSKCPGTLGIYGFRNRAGHSSEKLLIANFGMITEDTVWDILGRAGISSAMLGVPQTYPPKSLNGWLVSCFLTPGRESAYTWPPELKAEIEREVPDYMFDVEGFRSDDKARLLEDIHRMTDARHRLALHLLKSKDPEFFMMVEMGPDRMHHAFWRFCVPEHPEFEPGNEFEHAMLEYYRKLDRNIGELLEAAGKDATVMVVSDHGARTMSGGVCINEWLIREGYLSIKSKPDGVRRPEECEFDWSRTRAWGEGGYYGRLFLNVKGREPNGTVSPEDCEPLLEEITAKLESMTDESGRALGTRVYRPSEVYPRVKNVAPDLIIYFGDLAWRSVGSIGGGEILTRKNDTGPDDANHDRQGVFILAGPGIQHSPETREFDILDVAPTVLRHYGLEVPADMEGKPLI